jgi:NADH:ubiquinone oxidoreductase subunit
MGFISKIFTWWDGATIGTALFSARNGVKVGSDDVGNIYYQSKLGDRRWVIYSGANDASLVSPDWHGWLHHTHDGDPESYLPPARGWEHNPTGNLTGTGKAYRPAGALEKGGQRAKSAGDYEAWNPDA